MKYVKKPVVIEAIQWGGNNLDEVMEFCEGNAIYQQLTKGAALVILTLEDGESNEAKHVASVSDYIIKGVRGEFYPCKPDIFALTYDLVEPQGEMK